MKPEFYMQIALEQAQKAAAADEVPVGAVVVDPQSGEVIAVAHNLSEHGADAAAHAELLAAREACQKLGLNRLRGLDIYVTLEPCTMCAAALSFFRISRIFFGAEDPKGGAVVNGVKFYQSQTCHHKPEVIPGILSADCSIILKKFFQNKRLQKLK